MLRMPIVNRSKIRPSTVPATPMIVPTELPTCDGMSATNSSILVASARRARLPIQSCRLCSSLT